jgi:hypothetical protein
LNSNFSPVSIPPSFPRFFHSPSSYTISLGSTNSIPFFSVYLVQRWKAFIPS